MGDYQITDDEKLRIANAFLLNSPPGEFNEVVTDVRALVGNDDLLNQTAHETFKKYNEAQMISVDVEGTKCLITKYAAVGTSEYACPKSGKVFTYDHFKGEVTAVRDASAEEKGPGGLQELRGEIEKAVEEMVKDRYPDGVGSVYAGVEGDNKVTICVSASKFNSANFCNGRWRSVWTVTAGDPLVLNGRYKVEVHYFEDGNVQLNSKSQREVEVKKGASAADSAKAVVKAIVKEEGKYQDNLNEHYKTMGDTSLKGLRRALPMTRKKIEWEKVSGYKLGSDLSGR